MGQTVYATFQNATQCEQAAGALLDYGVRKEDLTVVAHESWSNKGINNADINRDYSANVGNTNYRTDSMGNRVAEAGDRTMGAVAGAVGAHQSAANYEAAANQRREVGSLGGETRGGAVLDRPVSSDLYETRDDPNVVDEGYVERIDTTDPLTGQRATATVINDVDYVNEQNRITAADGTVDNRNDNDIEGAAKSGISVTTPGDAASGAAKGAGWGLGLGVIAGIASLAVPGVGLVLGGGALATAIAGAVGATVAGAAAGGVTGYLKDQGVPDAVAVDYDKTIQQGGAMLAVIVPSNNVDGTEAEQILRKYGASKVDVY